MRCCVFPDNFMLLARHIQSNMGDMDETDCCDKVIRLLVAMALHELRTFLLRPLIRNPSQNLSY